MFNTYEELESFVKESGSDHIFMDYDDYWNAYNVMDKHLIELNKSMRDEYHKDYVTMRHFVCEGVPIIYKGK